MSGLDGISRRLSKLEAGSVGRCPGCAGMPDAVFAIDSLSGEEIGPAIPESCHHCGHAQRVVTLMFSNEFLGAA